MLDVFWVYVCVCISVFVVYESFGKVAVFFFSLVLMLILWEMWECVDDDNVVLVAL